MITRANGFRWLYSPRELTFDICTFLVFLTGIEGSDDGELDDLFLAYDDDGNVSVLAQFASRALSCGMTAWTHASPVPFINRVHSTSKSLNA